MHMEWNVFYGLKYGRGTVACCPGLLLCDLCITGEYSRKLWRTVRGKQSSIISQHQFPEL